MQNNININIDFGKIFSKAMELSYHRHQKWWNFIFRLFYGDLCYVSQCDLDNASEEIYPNNQYAKTNLTAYRFFFAASVINTVCV